MSSVFTLAFWQLRRTKGLLFVVGLGIVVAVTFVCVAPIYAKIAMTAGLRSELRASSSNVDLVMTSNLDRPFWPRIQAAWQEVISGSGTLMKRYEDPKQERFTVASGLLPLLVTSPGSRQPRVNGDNLVINGSDIAQAQPHLKLLAGSLPQPRIKAHEVDDPTIEIAITEATSKALHAPIGSSLQVHVDLVRDYALVKELTISLKVIGIIQTPVYDPYWRGIAFDPLHQDANVAVNKRMTYAALTANETLVSTLAHWIPLADEPGVGQNTTGSYTTLSDPLHVSWNDALNPDTLQIDDLDPLIAALGRYQFTGGFNDLLSQRYGLTSVHVTEPQDSLYHYQAQIAIAQLPTMGLMVVIFLLLLYFVSLMTDLLVERQAGALAILRSRGASRGQVFGALLLQGGSLALLALIVGPLLALPGARLLGRLLLAPRDYSAIGIVLQHNWSLLLSVCWYALATVLMVALVLMLAINRTTALDVLAIRRESSRSRQRPFWLRFNLDVVAIVLMVIGYLISMYLTNTNVLDAKLRLLLLSPLVLARTICTILAAILVFLRCFPALLRLGSWIATRRSRGASSMVALAQLSRSPRQAVRMTMLLSLVTAFSMFALIFYASQIQRANDVAAHTVGADFQATLPANTGLERTPNILSSYQSLPGVQSASLGYSTTTEIGDSQETVNLLAVDAESYDSTASWPQDNSTRSLHSLMQQLISQRAGVSSQKEIPAIIDETFWQRYHLKVNDKFSLTDPNNTDTPFHFRVLAKIQQIPTQKTPSGILVDLQSYGGLYNLLMRRQGRPAFQVTTVWLLTSDNPTALHALRTALQSRASVVNDRRLLVESLHQEPLYLQVMGMLALGPLVALLLVLVGNLVASWLSARDRLTNFALLRALGASPRNIATTLSWEQSIIYATSIILGVIFGALLSWMAVPSLLFTSAPGQDLTDEQFFLAQNIPPIQIIIPALLGIGLAVLVAICILALGMMVRIVSSPSMAMTLRLNED
ncbi:hypothetical protein KDW_17880 [Dictyobacter vulcani]|uniref:ABC3 transporter permease C-terminal domain-containing protein n=1 Tax=Dictyobacter vulcani TaxID=2607529 RepID=A0A5J4KQY7_9CHLR|nr:FtsX-like permease family protein [Dictyobacter vulcani]GER87626.1 hypothetical protein KDW_17880 [Dictyobacter vulcani]